MALQIRKSPTAFQQTAPKLTKKQREKSDGHLSFIRTLPCVVTGKRPVHAAHIRYGDWSKGKPETGMGEKPHDRYAVPLHPDEHSKQHSMNERDYWVAVGIDPIILASLLWANTGDEEACEQIIAGTRPRAQAEGK